MIEIILCSLAALGLALLALLGAGPERPTTAAPGDLPRSVRSLWGLPQMIASARTALRQTRRDATS